MGPESLLPFSVNVRSPWLYTKYRCHTQYGSGKHVSTAKSFGLPMFGLCVVSKILIGDLSLDQDFRKVYSMH